MSARRALATMLATVLTTGLAASTALRADEQSIERPVERPYGQRADVQAWMDEIAVERGLDRDDLQRLMDRVTPNAEVLELIARPAEKRLEWRDYRPIFMTEDRIAAGRAFLDKYAAELASAERRFGVPKQIVTAIIGVETYFGRITGRFPVLDALSTLAFDYPPRADFFRAELGEFLGLSRREGWDRSAVLGSYAGAMGLPQFISSSYRRYAVDGDGDGTRDLFDSPADVIASVANYLAEHGWRRNHAVAERWWQDTDGAGALVRETLQPEIEAVAVRQAGFDSAALRRASDAGEPVSVMRFVGETGEEWVVGYKNFYAITRYNHSRLYARAVVQLAFALD